MGLLTKVAETLKNEPKLEQKEHNIDIKSDSYIIHPN
tara:strand:+ start:563 stop:673 length:111 start_codon:yes stop_codon:yes gene_type:complete